MGHRPRTGRAVRRRVLNVAPGPDPVPAQGHPARGVVRRGSLVSGGVLEPSEACPRRPEHPTVRSASSPYPRRRLSSREAGSAATRTSVRAHWPTGWGDPPAGDAQRRTGLRRRVDAVGHLSRGRAAGQLRPDVALPRGHREPRPDLDPSRHPDPGRSLVALARRARRDGCRRHCSRASTRSARCATSRPVDTATPGSCWTRPR